MVVTALDEIAWLFNIRGDDIPHTPVVKAYAFVSQVVKTNLIKDYCILFT